MNAEAKAALKSRFPVYACWVLTALFVVLFWPRLLMIDHRGVFAHLEDVWIDRWFKVRGHDLKSGDPRIIVVALDEDTGKKYTFPVPRATLARIMDRASEYGVKLVAFDMLFMEPRPGDKEFIAATRRNGRVVHLYHTETKETAGGEVVSVHMPIAGLAEASQGLAYPNVDSVLDTDGHVRRAQLFDPRINDPRGGAHVAASFDAVVYALAQGLSLKELAETHGARQYLVNFRVPKTKLRHEKRDRAKATTTLNLPEVTSPYRHLSAMDLIEGELTAEEKKALKGAILLVGSTTLGYFDHYPTPFTPQAPGVDLHANVIDNLLNGDFLRAYPRWIVLLVLVAMVWLPMWLMRLPPAAGAGAACALAAGWYWFCWSRFAGGTRVHVVTPLAALLTSFIVHTVHRVLTEGAEKKFITNLFGQFVAPEVVRDLARDPSKVRLGGEKAEMTVFFLDIAHFTNISEKVDAQVLIQFLNRYLSALSHVVLEQKGVVDKYIGDCVMAFWNPPILPVVDHRARACLAAVECQEAIARLNKDMDPAIPEVPAIRIGLNSGTVTVGLTGSEKKLAYTVLGDEVNLASRLEGANKFFGSHIMASESTYQGAKDAVEARELGRVRVVGKDKPIRVYEVLAKKGTLSPEWARALPRYEQGYAHFYAGRYEEAAAQFQEVLKIFPKDGPASLYLNTAKDYAAIPPDDKNIVFNLTAK